MKNLGGNVLKKQNFYSIRKLSVGIASVTLGALLFLGVGSTSDAQAAEDDNAFIELGDGTVVNGDGDQVDENGEVIPEPEQPAETEQPEAPAETAPEAPADTQPVQPQPVQPTQPADNNDNNGNDALIELGENNIVNADGKPVDETGALIPEPAPENPNTIVAPKHEVVIQKEDGTYVNGDGIPVTKDGTPINPDDVKDEPQFKEEVVPSNVPMTKTDKDGLKTDAQEVIEEVKVYPNLTEDEKRSFINQLSTVATVEDLMTLAQNAHELNEGRIENNVETKDVDDNKLEAGSEDPNKLHEQLIRSMSEVEYYEKLSDDEKDAFLDRLERAENTEQLMAIMQEAMELNDQRASTDYEGLNEEDNRPDTAEGEGELEASKDMAVDEINALDNLTAEEKAAFINRVEDSNATANILTILQDALDAAAAKEAPKAEEPKAEEPKEEPKAEEPKTEEPKAEEPKAEEPKEEPKAEEPKETPDGVIEPQLVDPKDTDFDAKGTNKSVKDDTTKVHVVKQGDTVAKIAQQNGTTVDAIVATNGLKDPNHIVVGQKLEVPSKDAAKATESKPAAKVLPETGQEGNAFGVTLFAGLAFVLGGLLLVRRRDLNN